MKALNLSYLESLRTLTIGEKCFANVTVFSLSNLQYLNSITIGSKSFNWKCTGEERNRCIFSITSCHSLHTIIIGAKSFCDYQIFVIEDLPSLTLLSIGSDGSGKNCFDECPVFTLSALPSLKDVIIGEGCFRLVHDVSFIGN